MPQEFLKSENVVSRKFETLEEVREYLSGDKIMCLKCGKWFLRLTAKHLHKHDTDADGYREEYGIPWTYSLACEASRENLRRTIKPHQIEALLRHVRARKEAAPAFSRKPPAVVSKYWRENTVPQGPEVNARVYCTTNCYECNAMVHTTRLCATQIVRCKKCSTERTNQKRREWDKRMRETLKQRKLENEQQVA